MDTPGYANTYTYDGTGNRLTQAVAGGVRTTYQYGAGNRLLSEQTGTALTTYSYDQAGNLALINAANALTTYSWNTDNRLTRVDNPDGSVEQMVYGGDGQRKRKSVIPAGGPTSDTIFAYDGQNLLQERDASGLILTNYTWGPDNRNMYTGQAWEAGSMGSVVLLGRVASTPGDLAGGSSTYFGADLNGNTSFMFDTSGNVTDSMIYEAFGEPFQHVGATVTPFGFGGAAGYYTDALRRLNAGWRVYDPVTGRWISMDPIGFDGGLWNLCVYVGNNAVNRVDPSGQVLPVVVIGLAAYLGWCLGTALGSSYALISNPNITIDQYRHCMAGCYIAKYCPLLGTALATEAAVSYEVWDWLQYELLGLDHVADSTDITTTVYGAACGHLLGFGGWASTGRSNCREC